MNGMETVYHVVPLSNFARCWDKYASVYDKGAIPQSRFPDRFFALTRDELAIGLDKTEGLVRRLGLAGDRPLVLVGDVPSADLRPNLETGRGRHFAGTRFPVRELFVAGPDRSLESISTEEACAASFRAASDMLLPYASLRPRTLSVLPIARACQARCKFCFSEASVSVEQLPHRIPVERVEALADAALALGAGRFVITGGGEPGILPHLQLVELIRIGSSRFPQTVLITNGLHLAKLDEGQRRERLRDYARVGLSVLSVSRHHWDGADNAGIMGIDTRTDEVAATWREGAGEWPALAMRTICVLQRGGVEDDGGIASYLDWAARSGIDEVCFKELYVSTTLESAYHSNAENRWSREHQVPLALVTRFLDGHNFTERSRLPWGSPVLEGEWRGRRMRVAAYTEPSLYWERTHGVARSWNLMSDASCLASLEDPGSVVFVEDPAR